MGATNKHIKSRQKKIFDTNIVSSRLLQRSSRGIHINETLKFELAPVPTSMFEDSVDEGFSWEVHIKNNHDYKSIW